MKKLVWHISIIFIMLNSSVFSENHYIDNAAEGENNGISWEHAWQSFANIGWNSIQPGDTIFISGGTTIKTYREQLTLSLSGTSENMIVITNGHDPGHDGNVLIDGEYVRHGIYCNGSNYIVIQNMSFDRNIQSLRIGHGTGIVVRNIESNIQRGRGISCHDISNSLLENCTITTDIGSFAYQTDGIYIQYGSDNVINNNYILIRNADPDQHCDGIQLYHENNPTISNNYIEQNVEIENHNNGIWSSTCSGIYTVFNNIIYTPTFSLWSNTFGYLELGSNATLYVYNNTFIGNTTINIFKIDDTDAIIKNNIFVGNYAGIGIILQNELTISSNLNYNLYGFLNSTGELVLYGTRGNLDMNELRTIGAESNGIDRVTPLFVDIANRNFSLREDSPGIDAGIDLGSLYSRDKNDVLRPQGRGWDMGAYEFSGNIDIPPLPPQNLRVE
jgi:hypothetical protein